MKKIIISLIGLAVLVVPASSLASHSLVVNANTDQCGKAVLSANVTSAGNSFEAKLDGNVIGTGTMGSGIFQWTQTKEIGGVHTFSFKVMTSEHSEEKSVEFEAKGCDAGGGSMHPCILEGTCPCIGFTYWELEKGYCSAEHMILPAEYLKKQELIRLATLLERLVALYNRLIWSLGNE